VKTCMLMKNSKPTFDDQAKLEESDGK